MPPFFQTIKSFKDVQTEPDIDTVTFLEASEGVVHLFDRLGSAAFIPVKEDLTNNIKKVRDRYNVDPVNGKGLKSLIATEMKAKQKTATEGLLWLIRGLDFTQKAMDHTLKNPTTQLSGSFSQSYDDTLRKHHNFVVRGVFSIALKACPYRQDLFNRLMADPDGGASVAEAEFNPQLDGWVQSLGNIVAIMQKDYTDNNYKV